MADDKVDSKVDATPVDIQYEDILEETRKQFEAAFQKEQEDAKNRLLACFRKTRQGMFKKEEFKMTTFTPPPPNASTTATAAASSTSTPSEVSFTFDSIKQIADAFLSRFEQSQKFTQDMLIDLTMQNKGKKPVNEYSNFTANPSLSAAPSDYQYGMPPNYFSGQTPPPGTDRPSRAEPVRSVAPTGQTGAPAGGLVKLVNQTGQTGAMVLGSTSQPQVTTPPASADYSLERKLADFVPSHTTKSYGEPPFPPLLP